MHGTDRKEKDQQQAVNFKDYLVSMATSNLDLKDEVVQSKIVRFLAVHQWCLMPFSQLVILTTQYTSVLGISVLLFLELSKLSATLLVYKRLRHLKSLLSLLLETLPSAWLSFFLIMALFVSQKEKNEVISEGFQQSVICSVMFICLIEYLLLASFVVRQARAFVLKKKVIQENTVRQDTLGAAPSTERDLDSSRTCISIELEKTDQAEKQPVSSAMEKMRVILERKKASSNS